MCEGIELLVELVLGLAMVLLSVVAKVTMMPI